MSDPKKKENLFAKLAQQNAQASREEVPVETVAPPEELPPSPPLPESAKQKTPTARKKAEPVYGKRGNPEYCQANAYVPKSLRKAVDRALLDIDGLDYSSLITDLLRKWVKSRGVSE